MVRSSQRRVRARTFTRAVCVLLAVLLSGLAGGGAAVAAEVVVGVEHQGVIGTVRVPQGQAAGFDLKLTATGLIDTRVMQSSPARATVPALFSVGSGGVAPGYAAGPQSFWCDTASASGKQVTWAGAPAPIRMATRVTAAATTPLGKYKARIPIDVYTPVAPADTTLRFNDAYADYVTFQVVPPDLTAPVTTAQLTGPAGDNGWYLGDTIVALAATDNVGGTGVLRTEVSTDTVTWSIANSVCVAREGITTIYYRSRDMAGNCEAMRSVRVCIDCTDPVVNVSGVTDGCCVRSAEVCYECSDDVAGSGIASVSGLLNGAPFASGTILDATGDYTLEVTARDVAGRTASRSLAFSVDSDAPSVEILSPADGGAFNSPQISTLTRQSSLRAHTPSATCLMPRDARR